jgi:hypothetical protein
MMEVQKMCLSESKFDDELWARRCEAKEKGHLIIWRRGNDRLETHISGETDIFPNFYKSNGGSES